MPDPPLGADIWDEVPLGRRGYDDVWQRFPALAYFMPRWQDATDEHGRLRTLTRPLFEEALRAQFAAIAELAGWASEALRLDPHDPIERSSARRFTEEIEHLARSMRLALMAEEPTT